MVARIASVTNGSSNSNATVINPCKSDPELKGMLEKLDYVKTARAFKRWRSTFLSQFEQYLEEAGIDQADEARATFNKSVQTFCKLTERVNAHVDQGDLTVEKYFSSVKARNCLNEFSKTMTQVVLMLDDLIPSTGTIERQRGYNKFHMGAVLIRDDFAEYGSLTSIQLVLQHMRQVSLNQVADKQVLEEMDNYAIKLQKFCDVMADICLYEVMLKCREFADAGPDNLSDLIFLDLKTGGIGEISREECLNKRVLTADNADDKGNEQFNEVCNDVEAQDKILEMVRKNTKLGLCHGHLDNAYQDEDALNTSEQDKIKNMWGVTLRKTPKNKKGEEFVFIDQKTGDFGELSRKVWIEKELITEIKDAQTGKLVLGEAITDFEERNALAEHIRNLLKLGIAD